MENQKQGREILRAQKKMKGSGDAMGLLQQLYMLFLFFAIAAVAFENILLGKLFVAVVAVFFFAYIVFFVRAVTSIREMSRMVKQVAEEEAKRLQEEKVAEKKAD